ncbi:MAG: LpxI family protein [Rhodobacteraceae bacterium]|nr:LpxI family protein [Paracoccaceae bacterium]
MSAPLAIVTGEGDLPRLLAEDCKRQGRDYVLVLFAGFEPVWARKHPQINATFERPAALFKALKRSGCTHVAFAGAMQRPKLNPLKFDWKFLKLAPTLLPALKSGDDVTLRTINAIFEAEKLEIVPPHGLLESLLAQEGVLSNAQPSPDDLADMRRGFAIARAAGGQDVGQGAVVAQGLCLGVESVQGTDAMLSFVAGTASRFRTDPAGGRGVLCKAPKPEQDWRVDLPTIGPQTIVNAAKAGLAGVAVEAGGVLVLGQEETVAKADELGLFLICEPPSAKSA